MPEAPPDYYNRLLEQRRAEYASKGLAKMPADFLSATARYLASMRELLEKEVKENPTSKKVDMTRVTYQRALASARDVLESRLTKIAQLAAQHVNLGGEPANLLPEERSLYDQLSRDLSGFRQASAPFLDGGQGSSSASPPAPKSAHVPAPVPPRPAAAAVSTSSASAPGTAPPRAAAPPSAPVAGRVVVRVLEDHAPLAFRNESIDLRKHDLLVLPSEQAEALIHARLAERVDVKPPTSVT